ncbi:MAG: hypothetical protein Q9227_002055 [Pyrenula ochraceoflavens]
MPFFDNPNNYWKLTFYVPRTHLDVCKEACFAAGMGTSKDKKYTRTCFETPCTAQFQPEPGANPPSGSSIGELHQLEMVKVEVHCYGVGKARQAARAMVKAHPFEQVEWDFHRIDKQALG